MSSQNQPEVKVHLLPQLARPEEFSSRHCVVIDILRACTTMTTALENGASGVRVTETVEQAHQLRDQTNGSVLLGGERGGVKIEGFDLDNSPRAYSAPAVAEKTIVFSTTNGTKAMHHARLSSQMYIGCFRNRAALVAKLSKVRESIDLVCAGTNGEISSEDVLFAGLLAHSINETHQLSADAETLLASRLLHAVEQTDAGIEAELLRSQGGRNLQKLGLEEDIRYCSQLDCSTIVPIWDSEQNWVHLEKNN